MTAPPIPTHPTILIVDDEQKVFNALRRTLRKEKYECVYANCAEVAEVVLGEQKVHVALVDMHMPGIQGSQLLARMRQQYPNVVRIMLTGDTRLDAVVKAVNHGEVFRFFVKPADEAELIIAIRDALQMQALKNESRRLLDTVKAQSQTIRDMGGDPAVIKLPAGDGIPTGPSKTRYSLDDNDNANDPGEVGDLVSQIRSELHRD